MDIEADNDVFRDRLDYVPDSGTPLDCALYYENIAAINHLLKRGANPKRAVRHSIGMNYWQAEFLPALGPLLDAGADPDAALGLAATRDDIKAAAICLSRGANPRLVSNPKKLPQRGMLSRSNPERSRMMTFSTIEGTIWIRLIGVKRWKPSSGSSTRIDEICS